MSLARRIWWVMVLSVVSAVLLTGLAGWFAARTLLIAEIDQALREEARRFSERLPGPLATRIVLSRRREGVEWRLIASDSTVVSDQWPTELALSDWPENVIQPVAIGDRQWRTLQVPMVRGDPSPWSEGRRSNNDDDDNWRSERRRPREGNPDRWAGAMMQVAIDVSALHHDLRRLALLLLVVAALVSGVAVLLAGRLRDALLAPLKGLTAAIADLPEETVNQRLRVERLPHELEQLRARLDEWLQRLATVRQRERRTLADIAHELRTPLATLQSEVDFARDAEAIAPDLGARLSSQISVLNDRFHGLLMLTRMDAAELQLATTRVSVAEQLADAWAPLAARAAARGLTLQVSDPGLDIDADPILAETVWSNLLNNAIAHGQGPAAIAIRVTELPRAVQIRVSNPVLGLSPGPRPQVFTPFWRADEARSASVEHAGLGLAIVERIVHAHGGQCSAEVTGDSQFVITVHWPSSSPA